MKSLPVPKEILRSTSAGNKEPGIHSPRLQTFTNSKSNLPLQLNHSHVRGRGRECPIRRGRGSLREDYLPKCRAEIRARIGTPVIGMVQPVIRTQAQLESQALADVEVLPQAHVAAQKARPTKRVSPHGSGKRARACRLGEQEGCG